MNEIMKWLMEEYPAHFHTIKLETVEILLKSFDEWKVKQILASILDEIQEEELPIY